MSGRAMISRSRERKGEEAEEKEEKARRSRAKPPTSLMDYTLSRGYCSVTDLVSPLWCEYAFQYNLLGMSHLPVSQRPEQIATPQGNIVKPNVEISVEREKILQSGREVHKRLEKEIHPVRIYVETTTKEDTWGLRLLQLITGLKVLLEDGCCVSERSYDLCPNVSS
jgi:exonuclease V